uniref:SP-RING-type domain-containing protein n=2 Tax=Rhizophora mucronata TaxID=61149 RepID=A0A2P2MH77_RHIMU
MLLNDKVPFRMQWPQYTELQVNGVAVRAINRPGSQLLGANGRDDGPIITHCTRDGTNEISLTGCDSRIFCLGVRIVRRRTVQQILSLIPKESDGERFEDALARVCRCVGGGNATDNADSDSDLEVVADSFTVNLRCPMSGSRIKVAGRFIPCAHMGCFDLEVFVELNQRSRKWQCPICLKNYSLEYLIIDPYFNRITSKMQYCGEDVTELEVKPDGSWRLKTKSEAECRDVGGDAPWHCPNGTLCAPNDGKPNSYVELATQIKQEGISEGQTGNCPKPGNRKNHNGIREFSRPGDMYTSSYGNRFQEKFENHNQNVIPMSSSATVSGRDGEDPSVNQDGGGNFDFTNNGIEHDSLSLNVDSRNGFAERNVSAPLGDAEVIILSDSDDEHDVLMSSGNAYKNNQTDEGEAAFSVLPGIGDPYPEDPTMGTGNLLFNPNDEEFISIWPLPSVTQGPPVFQLFSPDISDPLVGLHHGSANCPSTSINGYPLPPETVMGPTDLVPDPSLGRSETDLNDGLVDNPLAFGGEDPSLQIFLPTRPSDASAESDVRGQVDVSTGIRTDDWISLRLGGGVTSSHGESLHANGLNSRGQMPSREGAMDSLADTASLLGMNDGKSEKASQQRSDSPFSFPRQKRSVRQRLYFSNESESE